MVFKQFEGVFAPIPTPFSPKDRTINFDYIRRHLDFLNDKGAHGVVVLGTNGEFPSLSIEERKNIISWVMKFRGKSDWPIRTAEYFEVAEINGHIL